MSSPHNNCGLTQCEVMKKTPALRGNSFKHNANINFAFHIFLIAAIRTSHRNFG